MEKNKGIVVVSLFNGMGTLMQAMNNLGIKVDRYYSSEIKTFAIKLQQHHFPDVIQVGDIRNWREWDIDWSSVDFIGSGSPCQDLSSAGKRKGINGSKSSLFFIFIDILNHCRSLNPNVVFLQENVGSANKLDIGIMSRELGVYPVRINSNLVTAQNRDRYYWTNIRTKETMFDIVTDIPQPIDRNIMFKDILTSGFVERSKACALLERTEQSFGYKDRESEKAQDYLIRREKFNINLIYEEDNELRIKTNTKQGYDIITENDCIDLTFPSSKTRRARVVKSKSPYIMQSQNNLYAYKDGIVRTVNKIEMCRLQGFPDNYCDIVSDKQAGSLLGDGWTLPIIEHILSFYNPPKQ